MIQFLVTTLPFLWQGLLVTLSVSALVVATSLVSGVLFGIVQSHFDSNLSALLGATPVFLPWTVALGLVASGALLGAIAAYGSLRKLLVL